MISLGPDLAADFSADAAAPSSGAAPPPMGADANLFDDVLGQLMGEGGGDANVGEAADDDLDAMAPAKDKSADPAELVNPMFVEGVPSLATRPTIVWTVDAAATAPVPTAIGSSPETELPVALAGVAQAADHQPAEAMPAPAGDARDLPPGLAALTQQLAADAATTESPATTSATSPAAQPGTPAAAGPAGRFDRLSKGPRTEKAQAEMKIDATATRAVPSVAMERAYTGSDREPSKSFDSKPDAAPAPRLQSIGQPAGATAFVVPVEARAVLNAPPPAMTLAAAPTTVLDPSIEAAHVPQQIVQSIRMQAIDGGGEAVLRLRPEYLGEVVVAVKVEQGSVTAALQADTPAVRQWVERNEAMLRQGLAEHGLQLDRLTVTDKAADTENEAPPDREPQSQERPPQQQSRRRRAQTDDATFEVTV